MYSNPGVVGIEIQEINLEKSVDRKSATGLASVWLQLSARKMTHPT